MTSHWELQSPSDLHIHWVHDIVSSLADSLRQRGFNEATRKHTVQVDWSELGRIRPDLYQHYLQQFKIYIENMLTRVHLPSEKSLLILKTNLIFFISSAWEADLLTENDSLFYEPYIFFFIKFRFGFKFYFDLVRLMDWISYPGKCVAKLQDARNVVNVVQGLDKWTSIPEPDGCGDYMAMLRLMIVASGSLTWPYDSKLQDMLRQQAREFQTQFTELQLPFEECVRYILEFQSVILEAHFLLVLDISAEKGNLKGKIGQINNDYEDDPPPITYNYPSLTAQTSLEALRLIIRTLFKNNEDEDEAKLRNFQRQTEKVHKLVDRIYELMRLRHLTSSSVFEMKLDSLFLTRVKDLLKMWSAVNNPAKSRRSRHVVLREIVNPRNNYQRFLLHVVIEHGEHDILSALSDCDVSVFFDYRTLKILVKRIKSEQKNGEIVVQHALMKLLKQIVSTIPRTKFYHFMQVRIAEFDLEEIGSIDKLKSELPFDRRSLYPLELTEEMRLDLLFLAFVDPLGFIHRILGECLIFHHNLIPMLVRMCCEELSPLCACYLDESKEETVIINLLCSRLRTFPTSMNLEGTMRFIKDVWYFYDSFRRDDAQEPRILTLESLFRCFVEDGGVDEVNAVKAQVKCLKLIRTLTKKERQPWYEFQQRPVQMLYHLLQFIDFFYFNGSAKKEILEIIEFLFKEKLRRKLNNYEICDIKHLAIEHERDPFLIAYLDPYCDSPLEDVFTFSEVTSRDVALCAAIIGPRPSFIRAAKPVIDRDPPGKYEAFEIMKFLAPEEYINLYNFLITFRDAESVIQSLVEACMEQTSEERRYHSREILTSMINLGSHIVKETTRKFEQQSLKMANGIVKIKYHCFLRKVFREFSFLYYGTNYSKLDNDPLSIFLADLAALMKRIEVDVTVFQKPKAVIHYFAKHILDGVFGPLDTPEPELKIIFRPG